MILRCLLSVFMIVNVSFPSALSNDEYWQNFYELKALVESGFLMDLHILKKEAKKSAPQVGEVYQHVTVLQYMSRLKVLNNGCLPLSTVNKKKIMHHFQQKSGLDFEQANRLWTTVCEVLPIYKSSEDEVRSCLQQYYFDYNLK